jgi:hypothetical protein
MKPSFLYAAGAMLIVGVLGAAPNWAQSQGGDFDPARPFAKVGSPADWVDQFRTGKPERDPNDRFRNLTSREWVDSWTKRPKGLSNEEFLQSYSGSGGSGVKIRSPYPYDSAQDHFDAWLKAANGGTKPMRANLPDWSGDWQGVARGVLTFRALVRDVWEAVSPQYRPRFQQLLTAELEGRHWWAADNCLPDGMGRFYSLGGTFHFMMDPTIVLIDKDRPNSETRYVYTDGRGFLPESHRFPMWYGESQGFWSGDELIVWTKSFKPWAMTHALPEYSDRLEVIERVKRVGDQILVDMTLYDPEAFAFPWHDTVVFSKLRDWKVAPPTFYECATSNNVYHDENGQIQEYLPGDPQYRDPSDLRPWATIFERAEKSGVKAPLLRPKAPQ